MSDRIGSRIKELRIKQGLTQEELGELVGVKKAAINKYESGLVKNIKRDMQAKLAEALKTDPAALFYPDAPNASSSTASDLTDQEREHLEAYRKLNSDGQRKVDDFINDLNASGRYLRSLPEGIIKKSEDAG